MTDYAGQFNPGFRLDPARVALVVRPEGMGMVVLVDDQQRSKAITPAT